MGPAPTETTWNDQLHYAEGAGGGGISQTFGMPAFQQSLGTVSGSSGTPCGNSNGDCREVPDVSADADPSTGYVVYDSVNFAAPSWTAIGGTSGAAPLWAAVLAVAASADGNTGGYGAMNPILYTLAQKSSGTYLNDVTTGNNDYNAANNGQFSASSGYDMATGLGTPVTSALATGLTAIPLDVAVSGSQVYGGTPTFAATPDFGGGSNTLPFGVTLSTTGFSCSEVGTSTAISPALAAASYTLLTSSCGGVSLSGANASDYMVVYTSAAGDFTVAPGPVDVAVSGSQTYGGSPVFSGASTPPTGITVTTSGLSCTKLQPLVVITPALPAGSRTLFPGSCAGATLSGTGAADYTVAYTSVTGDFTITPAPLTVTASNASMSYGGTPPTISPAYSGFVNGDTASSLTTKPTCSTTATSASPVAGSPYASSCTGAVDTNYSFGYVPGVVTVDPAALTVTASSGSMTYGAAPPVITALYTGFVNGDSATSLTTPPTCSTTVTNASRGGRLALLLVVLGSLRPQLHHRIRHRNSDRDEGAADGHGLECVHELRGRAAGRHARLQRLRQRRQPVVAHHARHLLDHGDELEPGLAADVPGHLLGRVESQLRRLVFGGGHHDQPGRAHHHRLERFVDLRQHAAGHHPGLRRLRQRRHRLVTHDQTDLHDHGDQFQPGLGLAVSLVVHGSRRRQLLDRLRPGRRHREPGRAHRDGRQRLHDLRERATGDHGALHRLRQRRHRLVAHDQTDLHDHGHEHEPGGRLALLLLLLGSVSTPTTPSDTPPERRP